MSTINTIILVSVALLKTPSKITHTFKDLGPYPSGGTLGLINFANTESRCITQVFNKFIEYLPYIMLFQTLILVFAEKFTFQIPRIAQRVERFYKNIVEESLFGKGKIDNF